MDQKLIELQSSNRMLKIVELHIFGLTKITKSPLILKMMATLYISDICLLLIGQA